MLSRVAQNLYWLARYVERAEDTARLIGVTSNLLLDLPRTAGAAEWEPLIYITGSHEAFREHFTRPDEVSIVSFLTGDLRNSGSILSSLVYFEAYCKECESRSDEDAKVHRMLYERSARARMLLEDGLERLLEHEDVRV